MSDRYPAWTAQNWTAQWCDADDGVQDVAAPTAADTAKFTVNSGVITLLASTVAKGLSFLGGGIVGGDFTIQLGNGAACDGLARASGAALTGDLRIEILAGVTAAAVEWNKYDQQLREFVVNGTCTATTNRVYCRQLSGSGVYNVSNVEAAIYGQEGKKLPATDPWNFDGTVVATGTNGGVFIGLCRTDNVVQNHDILVPGTRLHLEGGSTDALGYKLIVNGRIQCGKLRCYCNDAAAGRRFVLEVNSSVIVTDTTEPAFIGTDQSYGQNPAYVNFAGEVVRQFLGGLAPRNPTLNGFAPGTLTHYVSFTDGAVVLGGNLRQSSITWLGKTQVFDLALEDVDFHAAKDAITWDGSGGNVACTGAVRVFGDGHPFAIQGVTVTVGTLLAIGCLDGGGNTGVVFSDAEPDAEPRVLYVDPNSGNDANDGRSWISAKETWAGVAAVLASQYRVEFAAGTVVGDVDLSALTHVELRGRTGAAITPLSVDQPTVKLGSYCKLHGLMVANSNVAQSAVLVDGATDAAVEDCYLLAGGTGECAGLWITGGAVRTRVRGSIVKGKRYGLYDVGNVDTDTEGSWVHAEAEAGDSISALFAYSEGFAARRCRFTARDAAATADSYVRAATAYYYPISLVDCDLEAAQGGAESRRAVGLWAGGAVEHEVSGCAFRAASVVGTYDRDIHADSGTVRAAGCAYRSDKVQGTVVTDQTAAFAEVKGAGWNASTDTLENLRDAADAATAAAGTAATAAGQAKTSADTAATVGGQAKTSADTAAAAAGTASSKADAAKTAAEAAQAAAWTVAEKKQIRDSLGVAGDKVAAADGDVQQILAKTNTIGGGSITWTSPVSEDVEVELVQGDDYAGGRILTWTVSGYTGDLQTGDTMTVAFIDTASYEAGTGSAALEASASVTRSGSTLTITCPLTAAETGALTTTDPPAGKFSYTYRVRGTHDGKLETLAIGSMTLKRTIA